MTTTALAKTTNGAHEIEAVDVTTGEVQSVPTVEDPSAIYAGIASQPVTQEQADLLMAPVDPADLDILPTGEVYLPQAGYRRRLNAAFKPGGWAMRPLGKASLLLKTLMQEWALYIGGRFTASAWGEQDYHESNDRQSYATALESLKSNALMRCCKDLGIASECWDRHFTAEFQRQQCVQVWRKGEKKPQWRRKDRDPWFDETGSVQGTRTEDTKPVTREQLRKEAGESPDPSASTDGKLRITRVQVRTGRKPLPPKPGEKEQRYRDWTSYEVFASDWRGEHSALTFDGKVGALATQLRDSQAPIEWLVEDSDRGPKLVELSAAVALPKYEDNEDIPF